MSENFDAQFSRMIRKLEEMKTDLPILVANIARNHFVANFEKEAFVGEDDEQWPQVNRRIEGTNEWKYPKTRDLGRRNRKELRGKRPGKLFPSIRNSIREATWEKIRLGTDVPYAAVHNYGLPSGRGRGFTMPRRRFMGKSRVMNDAILKVVKREYNKAMKA